MFKLTHLLSSTLAMLWTLNASLAAESPRAIAEKHMLFKESAVLLQLPQKIINLVGNRLKQVSKVKVEFSYPSTALGPLIPLSSNDIDYYQFTNSSVRYSVIGENNIPPTTHFASARISKNPFLSKLLGNVSISCAYESFYNKEEQITVVAQPLYSDGSVIDLSAYDIKIAMKKRAQVKKNFNIDKSSDCTRYLKIKPGVSPEKFKFVLLPK